MGIKNLVLGVFALLAASFSVFGATFQGCPPKSHQVCPTCQTAITEFPDGRVQFVSRASDDMEGAYGGAHRAEVLGEHRAAEGETFRYRFVVIIQPVETDGPYEVWKLKQPGHSAVIAIETRDDYAYIKHRYIDAQGREHGPTMARRNIPATGRMLWDLRIKYAKNPGGFIEVLHNGDVVEAWQGITMYADSDLLSLKYGIRGGFHGAVDARWVTFEDCALRRN